LIISITFDNFGLKFKLETETENGVTYLFNVKYGWNQQCSLLLTFNLISYPIEFFMKTLSHVKFPV